MKKSIFTFSILCGNVLNYNLFAGKSSNPDAGKKDTKKGDDTDKDQEENPQQPQKQEDYKEVKDINTFITGKIKGDGEFAQNIFTTIVLRDNATKKDSFAIIKEETVKNVFHNAKMEDKYVALSFLFECKDDKISVKTQEYQTSDDKYKDKIQTEIDNELRSNLKFVSIVVSKKSDKSLEFEVVDGSTVENIRKIKKDKKIIVEEFEKYLKANVKKKELISYLQNNGKDEYGQFVIDDTIFNKILENVSKDDSKISLKNDDKLNIVSINFGDGSKDYKAPDIEHFFHRGSLPIENYDGRINENDIIISICKDNDSKKKFLLIAKGKDIYNQKIGNQKIDSCFYETDLKDLQNQKLGGKDSETLEYIQKNKLCSGLYEVTNEEIENIIKTFRVSGTYDDKNENCFSTVLRFKCTNKTGDKPGFDIKIVGQPSSTPNYAMLRKGAEIGSETAGMSINSMDTIDGANTASYFIDQVDKNNSCFDILVSVLKDKNMILITRIGKIASANKIGSKIHELDIPDGFFAK